MSYAPACVAARRSKGYRGSSLELARERPGRRMHRDAIDSPRATQVSDSNYFGSCFGIMSFSFSMSLMFIFMPPGIMMSPGF